MIKEGSLNLARTPQDRVETALDIYYVDLVSHLLNSLEHELKTTDKMPNINTPLPIALSGGTVLPKGFQDLFEKGLRKADLPVEISEVRIADDPLNTTAKGAMVMALSEEI